MLHRKFDCNLIYDRFNHEKYASFDEWRDAARRGTEDLTNWKHEHPVPKAGESLPVRSELYGALKEGLKAYFFGKCAYCESEFDSVAWGDVEHYRPKRGVTEEPTHPGYYWLTYCESNLMPSCQKCNQGRGKRNHFPIDGVRATKPEDDIRIERPLLLNPYEEFDCGGDARHLRYVFEYTGEELLPTGRVDGLTERGKKSIEVYDLNRPSLVKQRRKNQLSAIKALKAAVSCVDSSPSTLAAEWVMFFSSQEEHASAVRAACNAWKAHYLKHHIQQIERATASVSDPASVSVPK